MNKQTHKCYSNYSIMKSYFRCFTTITRLINHSIDPSRFKQSIDRNRSITRWIDRKNDHSIDLSPDRSIDHSNFRSVDHSINQLIDHRSIDRPRHRSRSSNQSTDQSIKQSINQSILCSIISSHADTDVSSVSKF